MHRPAALAGLLLIILGLLLSAVPLATVSDPAQYVPSPSTQYSLEYSAPVDLLFPRIEFTVRWTASETGARIIIVDCGTATTCAPASAPTVASGAGPAGTLQFLGWANRHYELLPYDGAATFWIRYSAPLLGAAAGWIGLGAGGGGLLFALVGARPPAEEGEGPIRPYLPPEDRLRRR